MEYKLKLLQPKGGFPFYENGDKKYLHPKTFINVVAFTDRAGNFITGLTEQDEKDFEAALNKPKGFFGKRSKFWEGGDDVFGEKRPPFMYKYTVSLDAKGNDMGDVVTVDNVEGNVDAWKQLTIQFLLANPLVRKAGDQWRTQQLFEIVSLDEELATRAKKISSKGKAWSIFNEMLETEKEDLFYMINPGPRDIKKDVITARFEMMIEGSPEAFIKVAEDPNRSFKSQISKWIGEKTIKLESGVYKFNEHSLGKDVNTICETLSNPKMHTVRLAIQKEHSDGYKELASSH